MFMITVRLTKSPPLFQGEHLGPNIEQRSHFISAVVMAQTHNFHSNYFLVVSLRCHDVLSVFILLECFIMLLFILHSCAMTGLNAGNILYVKLNNYNE